MEPDNVASKQRRTCEGGEWNMDLDRISALPDVVLHHIMSFLSILEAVQTSILSSRWRYLWASMPHLDFDSSDFASDESVSLQNSDDWEMTKFEHFVDMVLLLRDTSDLQKFRLRLCDKEAEADLRCANVWIDYAVRRNVRVLNIDLDLGAQDQVGWLLTHAIFRCGSLQELQLKLPLSQEQKFHLPNTVCLGGLRNMTLNFVHFQESDPSEGNALGKILSGCPLLKTLHMECCHFDTLLISDHELTNSTEPHAVCPSLEDLDLLTCSFDMLSISSSNLKNMVVKDLLNDQSEIRICAPGLLSLTLSDSSNQLHSLENLSSLEHAFWGLRSCLSSEYMYRLLRGLYNMSTLILACLPHKYLIDEQLLLEHLPILRNLKKLKLYIEPKKCMLQAIALLLQFSPNLETLIVHLWPSIRSNQLKKDEEDSLKVRKLSRDSLQHLTTVEMHNFKGTANEHEFVKFLVANAKALKVVLMIPDEKRILY